MRRSLFISAILSLGIGAGAVIAGPITGDHGASAEGTPFPFTWLDALFILLATVVVVAWFTTRSHRLPRRPDDRFTMPAEYLAAFLLAMLFAQSFGALLLPWLTEQLGIAGDGVTDLRAQVLVTVAAISGQLLVAGVFFAVVTARTRRVEAGGASTSRMSLSRAAVLGLLTFPAVFLVMMIVNFAGKIIIWMLHRESTPTIAHNTLQSIVDAQEPMWQATMVLLVVAVVPIVEELLFRGLVQELLGRLLGPWPAILITSAAFAAVHIGAADWHVLPSLFVLSIALGWVYAKSSRLLAAIVLHAAFNLANTLLALFATSGNG